MSKPIKMILLGQPSTGKTSALCALAKAGYNLRVLDFDNGIDILMNLARRAGVADRISHITLTEPMGVVEDVNPKTGQFSWDVRPVRAEVWSKTLRLLNNWKFEREGITHDFGKPSKWTDDTVLVLDSLSRLSDAAFNYLQSLNGNLGKLQSAHKGYDPRRDFWDSQQLLAKLMTLIFSDTLQCNIIINAHIKYIAKPGQDNVEDDNKVYQGFPQTIGSAFSTQIASFFNTVLLARLDSDDKRRLYTEPQDIVGTKNVVPFGVKPHYPIETGLAEYFEAVRGKLALEPPSISPEPEQNAPTEAPAA